MSSNCYVDDCSADCCNYYGYCPDYSSSSYYSNSCYYYYSSSSSFPTWAIGPIIVGVIIIAMIAYSCYVNKKSQKAISSEMNATEANLNNNQSKNQVLIV